MKFIIVVLLAAFAASASAVVYLMDPDYNPTISEKIEIDDGKYLFGFPPLPDYEYGCWYLRFKVKSKSTIFVQFSVSDGEGGSESYEVMIGAWNNKATCVQRSNGDWLLDVETPYILNGDWQYFYISQSNGHWEIGFQSSHEVIASFYDDNLYPVKYVGIKSLEWSGWSFYWPGFGKDIIKTDIHNPGEFKWIFPEMIHGSFYFVFAVKSAQSVSLVFSGTNSYGDDVYEIMYGMENNFFSCLRRKKGEKPIIDVVTLDILYKEEYRYFWVYYDGYGHLATGRYGEEQAIYEFYDESPLYISYYGVTSYDCESWWKFYISCPEPQYVCEHDTFHLHCDYGLVAVSYALYGRRDRHYCYSASATDVSCGDDEKSMQRIQDHCRGKQDCYIDAENEFFDDPCQGTYKYLIIDYTCCVCN